MSIGRLLSNGALLFDVLIIGAGQGGIATAFLLQREHVGGVLVVDENPIGQEGPWRTFADGHIGIGPPVRGNGFALVYPHASLADKAITVGDATAPRCRWFRACR